MNKRGRPFIPEKDRKSVPVMVRLRPDEKQRLVKAASDWEMSVSEYIRSYLPETWGGR